MCNMKALSLVVSKSMANVKVFVSRTHADADADTDADADAYTRAMTLAPRIFVPAR